jgi:DNA-binding transcriptional MocR family regulator
VSEDTRHVIVEDEALAAGFTQIPNLVLRRSDLQPGAKLTYMVLLSYAWQQDHAYPGQDRLAADMGVSERSVITYLKQLQETGLITIRRRGLGLTNVYVLHRLAPRSEKSAPPEVQEPTPLEVQDLRPKKTQEKNTQGGRFESSKGLSIVDKYDEDRDVIANYITDFAREFADQAPVASSITRACNLYRASGLSLDAFADVLYAARQITKERAAAINGRAETLGGKPRMAYFFAVVEREIGHASPATGTGTG